MVISVIAETMRQSLHIRTCSFYRLPLAKQHKENIQYLTSTVQDLILLKYPHIGAQSIIFEVISVISVVISVIPVISVNRRTAWGAGFPCVRLEGVSVHHTTLSCFCFFLFFFLLFWSSLSSWALHSHTAKQHYRLQCWTDLSSNWDKGVLYCKEKWVTFQTLLLLLSTVKL